MHKRTGSEKTILIARIKNLIAQSENGINHFYWQLNTTNKTKRTLWKFQEICIQSTFCQKNGIGRSWIGKIIFRKKPQSHFLTA